MIIRVGLAGNAGAGKDTTALWLQREFPSFEIYHLADPIKECVNNLMGWSKNMPKNQECPRWGFSPRRAYQLMGTEFGRALSEDLWVNMAPQNTSVIVPDIRFRNEAEWIKLHGVLLFVTRKTKLANVDYSHSSETSTSDVYKLADLELANNFPTVEKYLEYLDDAKDEIKRLIQRKSSRG